MTSNEALIIGLKALGKDSDDMAMAKGFEDRKRSDGELIALMHSELSEALEAYRHGNYESKEIPGFSAMEEEFADLIIRLCGYAYTRGLNRLGEAIIAKMEYNWKRPSRFGGKKI